MKTKIHSCARLFALFCVLAISTTAVWALTINKDTWKNLGIDETSLPDGDYYILNYGAGKFAKYGSNMGLDANEANATLFHKNSDGYLYYATSTKTYYVWLGKTTTSNNYKVTNMSANTGEKTALTYTKNGTKLYKITNNSVNFKSSNTTAILGAGTTGGVYTCNTSYTSSYTNRDWVFIPKASFDAQKPTLYFAAHALVSSNGGGTVKCSFTNPFPNDATADAISTAQTFAASATQTVYFTAEANSGSQFVGWSLTDGGDIIDGATEPNYSVSVTSNSKDSENPSSIIRYAVFATETAESQLLDDKNTLVTEGNLSDMITLANGMTNAKIVLLKNVELTATQTITSSMTIDLNGNILSDNGYLTNLLNVNSTGVTLILDDYAGNGLLRLNANAASHAYAIKVTAGALNVASGVIRTTNTSANAAAKASAIYVAAGASATIASSDSIVVTGTTNVSAVYVSGNVNIATGAKIRAAASGSYAIAVLCDNSATTATINGGSMIATSANNHAYVISTQGTLIVSNGAQLTANTLHGDYAAGILMDGAGADVSFDGRISATTYSGSVSSDHLGKEAYGIWAKNGTAVIEKNAYIYVKASAEATISGYPYKAYNICQAGNGSVRVNGGKFNGGADSGDRHFSEVKAANAANVSVYGGYFVYSEIVDPLIADGYALGEIAEGEDGYSGGYRFRVLSADNPLVGVCDANGRIFTTLEDAFAYANNNTGTTMTIRLKVANYTLPAGNYTIPAKATLLIPYSKEQTELHTAIERVTEYVTPSLYCKLTLADGVNINLLGKIEVAGKQNAAGQGANGAGIPSGTFGQLVMNSGSKITMGNGSVLYAWGFVTGEGEIDARRGASVHEQFQIYDWKGGTASSGMLGNSQKVFPITQYFIQNVEVPTIYHPGAALIGKTSINTTVTGTVVADDIKIVGVTGSGAMFLMDNEDDSEDTWVRKEYDAVNDKQIYKVNSSASLGSIAISLGSSYSFDSKNYTLPITNNMKIELLTGYMDITQNTILLPGAEIEVDKEATVAIIDNSNISYDGSLYLIDADEWGKYTFSNDYAQQVRYSPTFSGKPNKRGHMSGSTFVLDKPEDATLFVHGTFDMQGVVYTTASGANIYSTLADAGTFQISNSTPSGTATLYTYKSQDGDGNVSYQDYTITSAKLKNGIADPQFTSTAGTTAGKSYCYLDIDGTGARWTMLTTDGCFVHDEASGIYYVKPADYVALKNGKTENADHTYSSANDLRTFILTGDCQWWEVEYQEESGLYFCEKNGIYYYYDEEEEWIPKAFTVKWQNWDGSAVATYKNIPYGSIPNYLGTPPSRTKDTYYTYDFIGWAPAQTPVTSDVTYVAQYERNDVMYTITWKDGSGNTIETDYCKMGQIPSCYNAPDMTNKEWSPAVSTVTGNTTYTLQTKAVKDNYTITWKNWDGTTLQTTTPAATTSAENVLAGYTVATPTKPALGDIEFTFKAWSPTVAAATADAVYTATFTEKTITYTITWKNYDGTTLKTDEVAPKVVPQYTGTTPAKPTDGAYTYAFEGWNTTVVAATEDAVYTASFSSTPIEHNIVIGANEKKTLSEATEKVNLTITSDGITSGQLVGADKLTLTGEAVFRLEKDMEAETWYAVAVPWTVNINTGIYANGQCLAVGDIFVIEFDATAYASADRETGTYWNFLNVTGKNMQPGKLYMIWLKAAQTAVEFHKTGGDLLTTTTQLSPASGSIAAQSNWNAIANPALYYANLTIDEAEDVLKYNGNNSYVVDNTANMIVGAPMFVQVNSSATVTAVYAGGAGMPAYRHAPQDAMEKDNRYVVEIARDGQMNDRIIVQTAEEKADEYVIGKDLAKMGVGTTAAQMWMKRYGTDLCKNTLELKDNQVDYPLNLFAPAAGEYILTAAQERGEATLYLTRNGQPVWNLSYGEYVLNLEKGTTTEYGLRLIGSNAPQITTGISNISTDEVQCTKQLRDGVIYILRGNNVYTIDGQLIK